MSEKPRRISDVASAAPKAVFSKIIKANLIVTLIQQAMEDFFPSRRELKSKTNFAMNRTSSNLM